MAVTQSLKYDDFILLNDHLSFHPGGLIATFNVISKIPGLNKEQTILDFGCGNGMTLTFLKKLGFKNLVGFDRNENAITLCRQRLSEINFYSNFENLISNEIKIDAIFLESVLSFNDENQVKNISNQIQNLYFKKAAKYIGIIDFYSDSVVPVALNKKMSVIFETKGIRKFDELKKVIRSFSPNANLLYTNEHIFYLDLSEKYQIEQQVKKVMESKLLKDSFKSEENAKSFFTVFVNDMLGSYSSFNKHFKYFEGVAVL